MTAPIKLKEIQTKSATITIVGMTPLIQHRFAEKAKQQMRDKHAGVKTRNREVRDPEAECEAACYRLSDGSFGIPLVAIKAAILTAAHRDLGIPRTLVSKGLFLIGDEGILLRLKTPGYKQREDVVRVGAGSTDLRYRPEFEQWGVTLNIEFDAELLTIETIVSLIERAGFGVGVGEWRPEKGGEYGRFSVQRGEQ